jgi:hypothetical protein
MSTRTRDLLLDVLMASIVGTSTAMMLVSWWSS